VEPDALEITAFKILMYLNENQKAQDPISHVLEYWIKRPDREYIMARIEKVLQDLVAKGVIDKLMKGGQATYRLNADKREEVAALLNLLKP
jgi:predicted transcriptional regulator